jgi:hypothetical protein
VDADDRVPFVLGHREEHPVPQDARVVDEDVQLAVLADCEADQFPCRVEVGDVAVVDDRAATRRADLPGDGFGGRAGRRAGASPMAFGMGGAPMPRLPAVVDDDRRAEPGQFQRLGPAEAAAGAGDDRAETFEAPNCRSGLNLRP